MLLRLIALGAAAYAASKFMTRSSRGGAQADAAGSGELAADDRPADEVALAGGPLSDEATLVHRGDDLASG